MSENGLKARQKRRFKRTTDSHHAFPVAPNLLEQDFTAERPDQKWGADISYGAPRPGWSGCICLECIEKGGMEDCLVPCCEGT
jgi:transposase InsO family protein